jgi:hypothetical protein
VADDQDPMGCIRQVKCRVKTLKYTSSISNRRVIPRDLGSVIKSCPKMGA